MAFLTKTSSPRSVKPALPSPNANTTLCPLDTQTDDIPTSHAAPPPPTARRETRAPPHTNPQDTPFARLTQVAETEKHRLTTRSDPGCPLNHLNWIGGDCPG